MHRREGSRLQWTWLLVAALALLTAACSSEVTESCGEPVADVGAGVEPCAADVDCPWGMRCQPDSGGDGCVDANVCANDADCDGELVCVAGERWLVCAPRPDTCATDDDCAFGSSCQTLDSGRRECLAANLCTADSDCADGEACVPGAQWMECQPRTDLCEADTDCPFGQGCEQGTPNTCVERNECTADDACAAGEACLPGAQWMECQPLTAQCAEDRDCPFGQGCEEAANGILACVDRNECVADGDCEEGEACTPGDQWNVCGLPTDECAVDGDCPFGQGCEEQGSGRFECVDRNECVLDDDCAGDDEVCAAGPQWNLCQLPADACDADGDCPFGQGCEARPSGWRVCVERNECATDIDCGQDLVCAAGEQWMVCRVAADECELSADCPYGFGCEEQATGYNACVPRNECMVDGDCGDDERCVVGLLWNVCEMPAHECVADMDCPFGWGCEERPSGWRVCVLRNECTEDADCGDDQMCAPSGQWLTCQTLADQCAVDGDCPFGFGCDERPSGYHVCVDRNECRSAGDCAMEEECVADTQWYVCRLPADDCAVDGDCPFGHGCADTPAGRRACVERHECTTDADCGDDEVCLPATQWNECALPADECAVDGDCPFGEGCEARASGWMVCVERDECTADGDCPGGHVCVPDAQWLVCERLPDECARDADCPLGYRCDLDPTTGYSGCVMGNAAPIFRGLRGAATAGGTAIRLDWDAAVDGHTSVDELTYAVYLSATSEGQDFDAPTVTVQGATDVTLTETDSALIALDTPVYAVVRAIDGAGAADGNRVELRVAPAAPEDIAFVDDTASGPGTLGDPSAPFPTIQAAIEAVEVAGGVVLVSSVGGTTYVEELAFTETGSAGVVVYGGFARFDGLGAGWTGANVLALRDLSQNETVLSGEGLVLADDDLVRVVNDGVAVQLDGFTVVTEPAQVAVRLIDGQAQVSGCTFRVALPDPAVPDQVDVPAIDYLLETGDPRGPVDVVGNRFETRRSGAALHVVGPLSTVRFLGNVARETNLVEIPRPEEDGEPDHVANVFAGGTRIVIADNDAATGNDMIRLAFAPVTPAFPAVMSVEVERNWFEDDEGVVCDVRWPFAVGDGGTTDVVFSHNRVIGTNTSAFTMRAVDTDDTGEPYPGETLNVRVESNAFYNIDSDAATVDVFVSAGGTTRVDFADNVCGNMESECLDLGWQSVLADGASDGGQVFYTIEDNVGLGDNEGVVLDHALPHDGLVVTTVRGNTWLVGNEPLFDYYLAGHWGESSAVHGTPDGVVVLNVFDNVSVGNEDMSFEFDANVDEESAPQFLLYFDRNIAALSADPSTATGASLEFNGPGGGALFRRSILGFGGVDSDETGIEINQWGLSNPVLARVTNNILAHCNSSGFERNSVGPVPQIVNNTIAYNGDDSEPGIDNEYSDDDDEPEPEQDQTYIHNCIVSHSGSSDLDRSLGMEASYSLVRDELPAQGWGNVGGEPLYWTDLSMVGPERTDFVAVADQLFLLAPESPAIDAGDPNPRYDDVDGTRNDMGARGGPGGGILGPGAVGERLPFAFINSYPSTQLYSAAALVDRTAPLTLMFNRIVDTATVSAGVTVFNADQPVAGAWTSVTFGYGLQFTPDTDLAPHGGEFVEVVISTALTAEDGEPHTYAETVRFAVEPAATAESEPNDDLIPGVTIDDLAASQVLGFGPAPAALSLTGDLIDASDVDVYQFDALAGDRIMLTVFHRRDGDDDNVLLEVMDADGEIVHGANPFAFGMDPYLDWTATVDGPFYAVVRAAPEDADNEVIAPDGGAYRLQAVLDR